MIETKDTFGHVTTRNDMGSNAADTSYELQPSIDLHRLHR